MGKYKVPEGLPEIIHRDREALQREQQMEIRRQKHAAFLRKRKQKRGRSRKRGSYED